MSSVPAIDRETARRRWSGRGLWLRAALAVAAVEAGVLLAGVLPRAWAVGAALVVLALYLLARRWSAGAPLVRRAMWAAAVSQAFLLLVPLIAAILGTLALIALGVLAVIVLVVLLLDR